MPRWKDLDDTIFIERRLSSKKRQTPNTQIFQHTVEPRLALLSQRLGWKVEGQARRK